MCTHTRTAKGMVTTRITAMQEPIQPYEYLDV